MINQYKKIGNFLYQDEESIKKFNRNKIHLKSFLSYYKNFKNIQDMLKIFQSKLSDPKFDEKLNNNKCQSILN